MPDILSRVVAEGYTRDLVINKDTEHTYAKATTSEGLPEGNNTDREKKRMMNE